MLLYVTVIIGIAASCENRTLPSIKYILPDDFEGAVVIVFDQVNGISPAQADGSIAIEVPQSGIVSLNMAGDSLQGRPSFEYKSKGSLSYVFARKEITPEGNMSFDDLTPDDFANKVYVMNYDRGTVNRPRGTLQFQTFIVCKPKDGNYYASRDKGNKIALATQVDQQEK